MRITKGHYAINLSLIEARIDKSHNKPAPSLRIFILQVMFYRSWPTDKEMRQAFDDTQRTFRMKYSNPYYWTGFVWVD